MKGEWEGTCSTMSHNSGNRSFNRARDTIISFSISRDARNSSSSKALHAYVLDRRVVNVLQASFFVEIAKNGVKEDVEFKKEQLKTLLIPETPKERAVDFKNDVEDLLLGTKQDLIGVRPL